MQYTFKLSHKIVFGMLVFLICAMGLGAVSIFTLDVLTRKMETRNRLEEIVSLAVEAQEDALDWLAHREELSMKSGENSHESPEVKYTVKASEVRETLGHALETTSNELLISDITMLQTGFNNFDHSFDKFQNNFNAGTEIVKGLRETSVQILAKALSLQKSIDRSARRTEKKIRELRKRAMSAEDGQDYQNIARELSGAVEEMQAITEKRQTSAILLNKPLGFQEMAKDFILYKDEKSGSGLIVDIEKLLGIDKEATMGASYPQFSPLFTSKREKLLFNSIVELTNQYYQSFKAYFDLSLEMKKDMASMDSARIELQEMARQFRSSQVSQYTAMQQKAGTTVKGITGIAAVIGLLLIILSRTIIINPLRRIIGEISQVSNGLGSGSADLSHRIAEKGQGELGQLTQAFNRLMALISEDRKRVEEASAKAEKEARSAKEALQGLNEAQEKAEGARREAIIDVVRKLEQVVNGLSHTSDDISAHVKESSSRALEQQESLVESSSALSQMTESIQDVARSCSDAVIGAGEATETATKGAEMTSEAVKAIFHVKEQSDLLKENLNEMNIQVGDITRIMSVVSDIADQTNLLALNAAIEAARAGDAGRGFAVVADEVRNLAEKTMEATKDVTNVVRTIQHSSKANVESMEVASQSILSSTRLAEQAGDALDEIVALVEGVTGQVQNISAATEQQSVSSDQINSTSQDINRMAEATTGSMEKSLGSAENLASLAAELRTLIENLEAESEGSSAPKSHRHIPDFSTIPESGKTGIQ